MTRDYKSATKDRTAQGSEEYGSMAVTSWPLLCKGNKTNCREKCNLSQSSEKRKDSINRAIYKVKDSSIQVIPITTYLRKQLVKLN